MLFEKKAIGYATTIQRDYESGYSIYKDKKGNFLHGNDVFKALAMTKITLDDLRDWKLLKLESLIIKKDKDRIGRHRNKIGPRNRAPSTAKLVMYVLRLQEKKYGDCC